MADSFTFGLWIRPRPEAVATPPGRRDFFCGFLPQPIFRFSS